MKVGDRVRLSAHGKEYLDWFDKDVEGHIARKYNGDMFGWCVQWDDEREGDTVAHHENELEVVS